MPRLRALVVAFAVSASTFAVAAPAFADDPVTVSAPTDPAVGGSYVPVVSGGQAGTAATLSTTTPTCALGNDSVTITFVHAGDCTVDAQKGAGDNGSVTFTIGKGSQTITFTQPKKGGIGQTEDLVATSTAGLNVEFSSLSTDYCTVSGTTVSYLAQGTCTLAADQAGDLDYNAAPQATVTIAVRLAQTITVDSGLVDGNRSDMQTLSAHTDAGLPITFTVIAPTDHVGTPGQACSITSTTIGAPSAPDTATVSYDHAGLCFIEMSQVGNTDYAPAETTYSSTQIAKDDQTITFPMPNGGQVGTQEHLGASSDSMASVTYTSFTTATCTVSDAVVSYEHAGTCTVAADSAETNDYNAAATVSHDVQIIAADQDPDTNNLAGSPREVGLTHQLGAMTNKGQTITWSTSDDTPACRVSGTTLTFVHVGSCAVTASVPASTDYNAVDETFVVTVHTGESTVTVATTSETISATVRQAVGSGADLTPGQVTFTVDGQKVAQTINIGNEGHATLLYSVPTGAPHTIAATYTGSNDLTGSTSSYTRTDPTISVALKSSVARTKYGWYRKPVTATFTCRRGSAAVTSCSEPATLIASGRQRVLTGVAATADGGASSITTKVNIDLVAPTVQVTGPANGAVYVGSAPRARCAGADKLSGLATCSLHVTPRANGVFSYVATAVDRAGNSKQVSGSYRLQNRYIRNSIFDSSSNSYLVQAGGSYTLVALAPTRPQYLLPVHRDQTPRVAGHTFYHDGRQANSPRWKLTVTLPASLSSRQFWNLGIKVGSTVYKVRIRIA